MAITICHHWRHDPTQHNLILCPHACHHMFQGGATNHNVMLCPRFVTCARTAVTHTHAQHQVRTTKREFRSKAAHPFIKCAQQHGEHTLSIPQGNDLQFPARNPKQGRHQNKGPAGSPNLRRTKEIAKTRGPANANANSEKLADTQNQTTERKHNATEDNIQMRNAAPATTTTCFGIARAFKDPRPSYKWKTSASRVNQTTATTRGQRRRACRARSGAKRNRAVQGNVFVVAAAVKLTSSNSAKVASSSSCSTLYIATER